MVKELNWFSEDVSMVISLLFGLYMIYSGIDGLISGEIHIGGRGTSSGAMVYRPGSIYISITFLAFGGFAIYLFVKKMIDYTKGNK